MATKNRSARKIPYLFGKSETVEELPNGATYQRETIKNEGQ